MNIKPPDILQALKPVISAFDKLSIPYYIGSSIASSVYGVARATMDVDIVAVIKIENVSSLIQILVNEYYIDEDMPPPFAVNIDNNINRMLQSEMIILL